MKLAWAVIVLFFVRFALAAWFDPGREADLSWQQWLGSYVLMHHHLPHQLGAETFTARGASWIPQEWAFSLAVALALPAHAGWLAVACALAAAGALAATAWRAKRRGASTFSVGITTIFTGLAMLSAFGARAQVFGWLLLALVLLALDSETAWSFLLIPLVGIWANIHASAIAAPIFVGAWTAGTWIEDRAWTPRVERNFVLTAGSVFAVFLTPLLWKLPQYALAVQSSAIRSTIQEWQPPDIFLPSFAFGVLPLLALCIYFGIAAPRERWRDGMLFAVACAMAFLAVRHLPLAALIIAPMAAQRLTSILPETARVNAILKEHFSQTLIAASTALASALMFVALVHTPAISAVALPRAALAGLADASGTHNVYCEDFSWCSLALQYKNLHTFLDGRCDPFPPAVWRDYLTVAHAGLGWAAVLNRTGTNAVLVRTGKPLAQALALRAGWRLFYRDRRYAVFLRDGVRTAQR